MLGTRTLTAWVLDASFAPALTMLSEVEV